MTDLFFNSDFDVELDHTNDFNTVRGRAEFEQSIAVKLTQFTTELTGDYSFDVLKQKIRYRVNQVANEHNELDSVENIVVQKSTQSPDVLLVNIVYSSSATFSTSIST